MSKEPKRAGANPAEAAPQPAQTETPAEIALSVVKAQLADNLRRGVRLLDRCEELADGPIGQSAPAIHAAARLLHGQIAAANALVHATRGESCHRTIVEYANGKSADGIGANGRLNSNFSDAPPLLKNGKSRPSNGRSPQ